MAANTSLVKTPHTRQQYSEHQLIEFAKCMDPENGHIHFLTHYFYIQHPTKGKLLFDPFPFQLELLDAYHKHRLSINMIARQCGKTTCAAGYLLWHAMFNPDQTILVAAHKFTGSQEIMQRIRYAYELCPDFIRAGVVSYNKGSIDFDNGSRIVSTTTTETTGRGMSISLLYMDELAYVLPNITDAMWRSISPTLSTGGKAIITSTPNTDEDLFATLWKEANNKFDEHGNETEIGVNGFYPYFADWRSHPERDDKWAFQERAKLSDIEFEREHECKFITFEETLINPIFLSEMNGINPLRHMGQSRWYREIKKDKTYLVSLDPSLGTGGNNAAIQVFELPTFEQVAEWNHNLTPIQGQIRILREILLYIIEELGHENNNSLYWSIENNTVGEAGLVCIKELGEERFPGMFLCEPQKKGHVRKYRRGFSTTHKTKINAAARLKYLIESKKMKIYSKQLISELKVYIATGVSFQAKQGQQDDLVAALLLLVRMSQVLADWDPTIFESFSAREHFLAEEEFEFPMPIFLAKYSF